jgi:hypothetical protein
VVENARAAEGYAALCPPRDHPSIWIFSMVTQPSRPVIAFGGAQAIRSSAALSWVRNPMDLDYRALSNAGLWFIGRLQTDADRARVLDGLAGAQSSGGFEVELGTTLQRIAPRWFVVRNAHVT